MHLKPSGVSDAQFLADMGWTKKVTDWKASHIAAGGTPGGGGGETPAVPQAPILLP